MTSDKITPNFLPQFYQSGLGKMTRLLLRQHIQEILRQARNTDFDQTRQSPRETTRANDLAVCVGLPHYFQSVLADFCGRVSGHVAGFCHFYEDSTPIQRASGKIVIARSDELPILDDSVQILLSVHGFEAAESPHAMLREAWRVLAPEGLILLVVPNRWGVWRYCGHSPFSRKYAGCLAENHAPGFSESELCQMLGDHLLTPEICQTALMWPPMTWPLPGRLLQRLLSPRKIYRLTVILEKILRVFMPCNGGVVICLARKRQNQMIGGNAPAMIRFFAPLSAQPAKNLLSPSINAPKPPTLLR
ncbi:MAG: methyltransferase domain-containing protein [Alphaproteobacteria bacterium]|nr:methyltransferase domain-containing protein [Alphaproteobacteria bacterium]